MIVEACIIAVLQCSKVVCANTVQATCSYKQECGPGKQFPEFPKATFQKSDK